MASAATSTARPSRRTDAVGSVNLFRADCVQELMRSLPRKRVSPQFAPATHLLCGRLTCGGSPFSFRFDAQSWLDWESVVVLVSLGRRLADGRSAIALALAEELDRAGRDLVAGPVLPVVPLPDARVLAAVAGIAA